jgi:hypothetical protein
MRRLPRPCLLFAALALLPGCGSDPSPGDAEPRRTLDSRAEAVRFFHADTQALVLVRSDMPRSAQEAVDLARDVHPYLRALVMEVDTRLDASGIDPAEVMRLARPEERDGPGSELVAGLVRAPDGTDALFVLPTERPDDLERLFEDAERDGGVSAAGEYDNAVLFRSDSAAFALRDGVLVAAADLASLRRALAIRDGVEARQLDDGDVSGALEDVPARAPVHLVAHRGERFAGVAIRIDDNAAEVRIAAEVPESDEEDAGPHRTTATGEDIAQVLSEQVGLPLKTASALARVAPLRGASYADGDRYIATFTVGPR